MRKRHLSLNKSLTKDLKLLSLIMLVSGTSCVDDNYDLGDIDLTINAGGNELVIPASSTKVIALKDLLDIEEGDIVQPNANGDYVLSKKGEEINSPEITVDAVTIERPTIKSVAKEVSTPSLPPVDFSMSIGLPPLKTSLKISNDDMPKELTSLTNIKVDADLTVTVRLTGLTSSTLTSATENATITFPPYLKSPQLKNGVLQVPANTDLIKGYTASIKVTDIQGFNAEYPDGTQLSYESQAFNAAGEIAFSGKIKLTGNGSLISVNSPTLTLDVSMSPVKVKEATGVIDPEIDIEDQDVQITDLPDFLDDNDVVFDIKNPLINLAIDNKSPVNAVLTGKLIAIKNGKQTASVNIQYTLLANKNNKVCFSRRGEGGANGFDNVAIPNLNELIKSIPDRIILQSDIKATNDEITVKLGSTYSVVPSYALEVPLAFGPELNIIYKENCNGWSKDLENFEVNSAAISMTAKNDTPLSLHITATAIDVNGNEMSDVTVKVDGNKVIKALSTSDINISLLCPKGRMKNVDGLLLRVAATSPEDSGTKTYVLNENQTVQFLNLKVKVNGGITADLN